MKINMSMEIHIVNLDDAIGSITEAIIGSLPGLLANNMEIDMHRISNVSIHWQNSTIRNTMSNVTEIMKSVSNATFMLIESGIWDSSYKFDLNETIEFVNNIKDTIEHGWAHLLDVSYILKEGGPDELSTDQVVASMTKYIKDNEYSFEIDGMTTHFTALREETVFSDDDLMIWCRGGDLKTYVTGEFDIYIMNETHRELGEQPEEALMTKVNTRIWIPGETPSWEIYIKILSTGVFYGTSDYLCNILFQQNINTEETNATGSVTVCENRSVINSTFCMMRTTANASNFHWNKDGSISYYGGMTGIQPRLNRLESLYIYRIMLSHFLFGQ